MSTPSGYIPLQAQIISITANGLVIVNFNKDIAVIMNLTMIDTKVLDISVSPGSKNEDTNNLNITYWNATCKELYHYTNRNGFQTVKNITLVYLPFIHFLKHSNIFLNNFRFVIN